MLSLTLRKVRHSRRAMLGVSAPVSGYHPSTFLDYLARKRTAHIAEGIELPEDEHNGFEV